MILDEEALYVHFYEMDTPELLAIQFTDLSPEEMGILKDVFIDRRAEVDAMIAALRQELNITKKKRTVLVPARIVAQVVAWEPLDRIEIGSKLD